MIRNLSFRRSVIALTLFLGLFTQFQMVFACEYKDGKLQFVCCCNEDGKMSMDKDMSMTCDMSGECGASAGPPPGGMKCCDVSYQPAPSTTAIAPELHAQQVLLLDAPQPPPLILTSFDLLIFPPSSRTIGFLSHPPPPLAGTRTYLLTNRFRI